MGNDIPDAGQNTATCFRKTANPIERWPGQRDGLRVSEVQRGQSRAREVQMAAPAGGRGAEKSSKSNVFKLFEDMLSSVSGMLSAPYRFGKWLVAYLKPVSRHDVRKVEANAYDSSVPDVAAPRVENLEKVRRDAGDFSGDVCGDMEMKPVKSDGVLIEAEGAPNAPAQLVAKSVPRKLSPDLKDLLKSTGFYKTLKHIPELELRLEDKRGDDPSFRERLEWIKLMGQADEKFVPEFRAHLRDHVMDHL